MNEEELTQKYKSDANWLQQLFFKQRAKYIKDESQLFSAVMGYITWAILLMMPFLALVLYGLYYRHNYYYVEHLIFAFHVNSFSFLVITLMIFGFNVFPEWIFLLLLGVIMTYFFISMWRVYKQKFWKTSVKFIILNIVYGLLFMLFLFGTLIATFFLL